MAAPSNAMTPAYIYPLHRDYREDVLNFYLYPDTGEINLGSGGGSAPHPSYGHSVKQLTGRLSPTFSFSLMFEGISPPSPTSAWASNISKIGGGMERYDPSMGNIAQWAFNWFMRNVGPTDTRALRDEAMLFVLKLWGGGSQIVSIDKARLVPMITSRAQGHEGEMRRFRVDLQGEYVYRTSIDPALFKKKAKPRARRAKMGTTPILQVDATQLGTPGAVGSPAAGPTAYQRAQYARQSGGQFVYPPGMAPNRSTTLAGRENDFQGASYYIPAAANAGDEPDDPAVTAIAETVLQGVTRATAGGFSSAREGAARNERDQEASVLDMPEQESAPPKPQQPSFIVNGPAGVPGELRDVTVPFNKMTSRAGPGVMSDASFLTATPLSSGTANRTNR